MPVPNKIDSNQTGLAYAEEATLKLLPGEPGASTATWYGLEPNSYQDMGASYQSVTRAPITAIRQLAKGTITDLDAKVGFQSDLTQRNLTRLLQGFFFADAIENPATNNFNSAAIPFTSVSATQYVAAAGLGIFQVNALVFAKNFGVAANNGLKKLTAVAAGALNAAGLAIEAGPPAAASLETVGYEYAAGDLVLTIVAGLPVLTSTAIDPTTIPIQVGEWIFVGDDAALNQYANNAKGFWMRIKAISAAAKTITGDLTNIAVIADAGAAKAIRIFFGKVLMNATVAGNVKRRSYNIERQLGNDGSGTQAEYVIGAVPNELTLNIPSAAKATLDLTMVGLDVSYNSGVTGVKAGTRVASPFEDAFNTSHDLTQMRLNVIDATTSMPTALYAFLSDMKLTLKNGVTATKGLAVIGGFDTVAGDFDVSGTLTAYFASVAALTAIRNNADVALSAIMCKKNAGVIFDIPLLMLGNGMNKAEKDKAIVADLSQAAAKNSNGYTMLWNFFEYLPTIAMPV